MTATKAASPAIYTLTYVTLKNVCSPEDKDAGRNRYCGIAKVDKIIGIGWSENVRAYLGKDADGKARKATNVNMAIRETLTDNRDLFPILNSGFVITALSATVDDNARTVKLTAASIINGAQTKGEIEAFFEGRPEDTSYPSVSFELIVTADDELIGEISIARNFQNRVADLSIFGRQGLFDSLETSMRKRDTKIRLRKSETDFDPSLTDTEKLVQAITAMMPPEILVPSAERSRNTPETSLRVYAYRHRARCLKDFAAVMGDTEDEQQAEKLEAAKQFYLDVAWDAWMLYNSLKGEQSFSSLHCVRSIGEGSRKIVASDGVPDGMVFPMLSALARFVKKSRDGWRLNIPKNFPWQTLFNQVKLLETKTAQNDPQWMGKSADCYIALHGSIDMFFAVSKAME